MPLEVCKYSRASRSSICKSNLETAPDRGFCASQNMRYYGYKLHAVCSVAGVFESVDISKVSVHDIHYLKDIKLTTEPQYDEELKKVKTLDEVKNIVKKHL